MRIEIDLARQQLTVWDGEHVLRRYPVSTSGNGAGEVNGSECTPRGRHRIRAKIGAGCPAGTVFVERRPTGEIHSPALAAAHPQRDWILTRILWLSGLERGRNRHGDVDTMHRCIYIHGTPDEVRLGVPGSHGCVRMRNRDVIDLFDRVDAGTEVHIHE